MELVLLNQDNYLEAGRFDSFSTIAWNIKWPRSGDFQLRSYAVEAALNIFNKGDVVGNSEDDTVMQITEITMDIDGTGTQYVEVRGESPLSVFNYRPAVREMLSTIAYDAVYPDGWFYGDSLGNLANVNPLQVVKEVIQITDIYAYGRSDLSYLSLPFTYIDGTNRTVSGNRQVYTGDYLQYYEVSGSVGTVLDELCDKGEFGMVVTRPNPIHNLYNPTNERPLGCFFYRPVREVPNDRNTFSYLYDDIISSSYTYRLVDNVYIEPREDYVSITKNSQPSHFLGSKTSPVGLNARVSYSPREIEPLDGYAYDTVDADLASRASEGEERLLDVSVETNGEFPYLPKKFRFFGQTPEYFLGDAAMVRTKGMASDTYLRVIAFVRTQDMNGYREYPEFGVDKKAARKSYLTAMTKYHWN